MTKVELAAFENGSWSLAGEYDSVDEAKTAAIELANGGSIERTDGVCQFGISSDPDSGHYETDFSVEVRK